MSTLTLGILHLQIESNGKKQISLFLPILLITLITLPLWLVAIPFYILFTLACALVGNFFLLRAPYYFLTMLNSARGTEVHIEEKKSTIFISIK